jgi:uncharacterized glyoxalase superfamily protein PhnB
MRANRSLPSAPILPELGYEDVAAAVRWLCDRFGFKERLRIGDHRAQLVLGEGAVIVTKRAAGALVGRTHAVLVRIVREPETHPYGERQYTAEDFGGHVWTFSGTVADVDPQEWGGELRGAGA